MGAARHSAGARSLAVAQPASMKETWHSANIAGDGPGRGARTAVHDLCEGKARLRAALAKAAAGGEHGRNNRAAVRAQIGIRLRHCATGGADRGECPTRKSVFLCDSRRKPSRADESAQCQHRT